MAYMTCIISFAGLFLFNTRQGRDALFFMIDSKLMPQYLPSLTSYFMHLFASKIMLFILERRFKNEETV